MATENFCLVGASIKKLILDPVHVHHYKINEVFTKKGVKPTNSNSEFMKFSREH